MVDGTHRTGQYPRVGDLRLGAFKAWTGEASFGDASRFEVTYFGKKHDSASVSKAVRDVVERVYGDERGYRSRAAAAWFQDVQEAIPFTNAWTIEDLTDALRVSGIIMDGDPRTIIVEYSIPALSGLIDKNIKTWFNSDGSVHHVSGSLPD